MKQIRKIVVPTDFSERSRGALFRAMELASCYRAEVYLVHVVELPMLFGSASPVFGSTMIQQVHDEGRAAAEVQLAKTMQDLPHLDTVPVHTEVLVGNPRVALIDYIESIAPDLVVVATEGRTGVSRFMIGSVAERIVRSAACPILTWRPGAAEPAANPSSPMSPAH